ncbi:hypothetical protein [Tepidibacillus marianensis]|uniref:hypothetical protein n=1 Tax=Tepidibacillus marianensis TaxID=3131995 RepID=UPI0030D2FA6F
MIGLMGLLVLSGCNTDQENEIIRSLKLTSLEDQTMKSAGVDEYFAYEFKSDKPHLMVVWVEYYEKDLR